MRSILCVLLVLSVLPGADPIRTGSFTTTFNDWHPESRWERFRLRYGYEARAGELYDPLKEEFDVYVPSSYDGSVSYGLIVYTNAGKGGGVGDYREVMDKHRVIWIGAANVPNERNGIERWAIALDAAWNMQKQYRIDPRRIYASGTSGGGRCASMVAPAFPDVFSGAIYLIGCNSVRFPSDKVIGKPIRDMAMANRYALMTGSDDFNKPGTLSLFQSMQSMGFKHVEYFEQPGLGHSNPSSEWFEKGLVSVDRPLLDEAAALLAQAKPLKARKPYDAATLAKRVMQEYPVASAAVAEAKAMFESLTPAVDDILKSEATKLATAGSDKLRAFALRADGFPSGAEAKTRAEAAGQADLDALLAKPGATLPKNLERFMAEWTGFSCAAAALISYDALAAAALEPVLALENGKRTKPLAKLLKEWKDCPTRMKIQTTLETDLAAELDIILAIQKPASRAQKLAAFAKAWDGTSAGSRASDELAKLTAPAK